MEAFEVVGTAVYDASTDELQPATTTGEAWAERPVYGSGWKVALLSSGAGWVVALVDEDGEVQADRAFARWAGAAEFYSHPFADEGTPHPFPTAETRAAEALTAC